MTPPPRILLLNNEKDVRDELRKIGVHSEGVRVMAPKGVFRAVKLSGVKPIAANILKQEMLSRGGEAAVSHGTIAYSVKSTDVIVFGTLRQFSELAAKLRRHQFGLPELAEKINDSLRRHNKQPGTRRTRVMGILNVTPDSFSDGGRHFSEDAAVARGIEMAREGADIIDVGGESTRPGAKKVSAKDELRRVVPVIRRLKKLVKIPISIDTTKSLVARRALQAGAKIINDVSGLHSDRKIAKVAADFGAALILMHMRGNPRTMQRNPEYPDLIGEILEYFCEGIKIAEDSGVPRSNLIIDPGIGFGKTTGHNLEILARLRELKCLGVPVMVGTSRKSFIGNVLKLPAGERFEGTAATVAVSIQNGADIVRVHDVGQIVRVARMADAIARR